MPLWFPSLAFADGTLSVAQLMYKIDLYILNPLIKFGFVVALVYFFWGVVMYIKDRDSGAIIGGGGKKDSGHILWGLLGILIMVSAFGILSAIKNIIGSDIATP